MPRLLRRKFVCFYCNRRSAQDRRDGVQQWQCEQCDAVNHLDEVRWIFRNMSLLVEHSSVTNRPLPSSLFVLEQLLNAKEILLTSRRTERLRIRQLKPSPQNAMSNPKHTHSSLKSVPQRTPCSANDAFRISILSTKRSASTFRLRTIPNTLSTNGGSPATAERWKNATLKYAPIVRLRLSGRFVPPGMLRSRIISDV